MGQDSWAVGQVVQALTILAHHHALATTEVGEEHALATPASRAPGKAELEGIGKENSLPRPSPSSLLMVQVWHCTALHCTALHCTALHYTALHCTALHCTALHLMVEVFRGDQICKRKL